MVSKVTLFPLTGFVLKANFHEDTTSVSIYSHWNFNRPRFLHKWPLDRKHCIAVNGPKKEGVSLLRSDGSLSYTRSKWHSRLQAITVLFYIQVTYTSSFGVWSTTLSVIEYSNDGEWSPSPPPFLYSTFLLVYFFNFNSVCTDAACLVSFHYFLYDTEVIPMKMLTKGPGFMFHYQMY